MRAGIIAFCGVIILIAFLIISTAYATPWPIFFYLVGVGIVIIYVTVCKPMLLKKLTSDKFYIPNASDITKAADYYVFDVNSDKWSNNNSEVGDNFGSFKAGAHWVINNIKY